MIHTIQPKNFNKEIDVVGCYIQHGDYILLLHRQPNKSNGGKLGLPAGKVDSGETIHKAMSREIMEETGLYIPEDKLRLINSTYCQNEGHDIFFHLFITTLSDRPEIIINPDEHQAFEWVTPAEALSLDLIHDLEEYIKLYYFS